MDKGESRPWESEFEFVLYAENEPDKIASWHEIFVILQTTRLATEPHMLDPFSPKKGNSAPAKKSWEEALVGKLKGGGGGSKSKAESDASRQLAEESEADFKKSDKVKDPPPPSKLEVVLKNPQWNAGSAFFDETMGASVEGTLPPEIAHLTRVTFTVNAKSPDGKSERIDSQEGHLAGGKASIVLTLWSPPFKDSVGNPVQQADYTFKVKHRDSKEVESPKLTVKRKIHSKLSLKELTFKGNNPVDNDTLGNFPAPEWKSGRAQTDQAPIAYCRNKKITMEGKFAVDVQPSVAEPVEISAKAKFGSASLEWIGTVNVNPGDTQVTLALVSNYPLPNEIGRFETSDITWHMKPKGQASASAGSSRNPLYVTLGDPSGTPNYWTLLDISCNGAAGAKDEDSFVKESFKPFTHTLGDGKGFRRKRDGLELTYYKLGGGTPSSGVFACSDLLSRGDGTGRCGAWARFQVAMHQVHGVTSSAVFGVVPVSAKLFIVKNCSFAAPGSLSAPFTHIGQTECVKHEGIPGQGKDNPQFTFGDHALVKHATGIYDPSYGVGPKSNLKVWEDGGVGGIGAMPPGLVSFSFRGDTHFLPGACSPGFILYTAQPGETLAAIALKFGIASVSTLYNHPYNANYRFLRPSPAPIQAGDQVLIPKAIANKVSILKIA
jgi:hypothetical protein